jgi:hypothetical protein
MINSNDSEKIQEVADPVDDKIFVDDEVEEIEVDETDSENSEDVDVDDSEEGEKEQEPAEPDKKESTKKQSDDENSKYAKARRESEMQMELLKQRQEQVAKTMGYNSFEEMEQYQERERYLNQGYDDETAERMVRFDRLEKEMLAEKNNIRITNEKQALQNMKFFKEIEPELDEVLRNVPNAKVDVVFNMLRGQKMEELLAKERKSAKQHTLNNLQNKSHVKGDGKGVEHNAVHVDPDEFAIYKKLNPKATMTEYSKWLKQNQ